MTGPDRDVDRTSYRPPRNVRPANIKGLDKAALLAELWNRAQRPEPGSPGFGIATRPMTTTEARSILSNTSGVEAPATTNGRRLFFGVLRGRTLAVDLGGDLLFARSYDTVNGEGQAQAAVNVVRNRSRP